MSNPDHRMNPTGDVAQARRLRVSMGLLLAAGVSVMLGFLVTQILTDRSAQRIGAPSDAAVARLGVPSSEQVKFDQPGTYDLYYEQDAPSTGVPGRLKVSIASDQGDLSLDTPDPVKSAVSDDRSYVVFQTVRIPRSDSYKVDVVIAGTEPDSSLFGDDRVVVDRANRETDALWMLLGLTPAAAGMALAVCFGGASIWLRSRAANKTPARDRAQVGSASSPHRWGPPTDQPFRDAPPPPEFPGSGETGEPATGDQPRTDGEDT